MQNRDGEEVADQTMAGHVSEARKRAQLLSSDQELRALHQELVKTGIISDNEFWEARKREHDSEFSKNVHQEIGISSSILEEMRPTSEGGTCNTITYKITPSVIHRLFIENPLLEKIYEENVPHKLSELEFWTKYFQSLHNDQAQQQQHSQKEQPLKGAIITTPASIKGHNLDTQNQQEKSRQQEMDIFSKISSAKKQLDEEPKIINKRSKDIDHSVDVSSNEETIGYGSFSSNEGYGTYKDRMQNPLKLRKSLPVIRKFNRHAMFVLSSIKQKKQKIFEETKIADLEPEKTQGIIPLTIQDPNVYIKFSAVTDASVSNNQYSGEDNTKSNINGEMSFFDSKKQRVDIGKLFEKEINDWRSTVEQLMIPLPIAYSINNEVIGSSQRPSSLPHSKNSNEFSNVTTVDISISEDLKVEVLRYFRRANELLRHFYSCFPLSSPLLSQKEERFFSQISHLYDNINVFKTSIPIENRSQILQLLLGVVQSLDAAVEYHNKEIK